MVCTAWLTLGCAATVAGVTKVLVADAPHLDHGVSENVAACIVGLRAANNYTHIFAPASNNGKNIIPRVAANLDVTALTDIMSVEGEDTFTRPMYAGNAIAKVKSSEAVKVCGGSSGGGGGALPAAAVCAQSRILRGSVVQRVRVCVCAFVCLHHPPRVGRHGAWHVV